MDDPRWLRVITVGLILAILAAVYFLLTGGLSLSKTKKVQTQTQTTQVVESAKPTAIPLATTKPTQTATPSAYNTISKRAQANTQTQTLPNTGFPVGLAALVSASAMISGLSLRKFPN